MSIRTFFESTPKQGKKYLYQAKKGSGFEKLEINGSVLLCTNVYTDIVGNIYANFKVVIPESDDQGNLNEEVCLPGIEIFECLHPFNEKEELKGRRVV